MVENWEFSPVILHLLLTAEPFPAAVALMEAGNVASLMDHQVVSLAEASVTPTTIKSFSKRLYLEDKFSWVCPFPDVSFTYLEWLFPVYNFCLVHVYAEADSKHLEYLGSGFTLGSGRCGHLISALDLTLKMDKTFKHGECSLFILRTSQGNTFLIFTTLYSKQIRI